MYLRIPSVGFMLKPNHWINNSNIYIEYSEEYYHRKYRIVYNKRGLGPNGKVWGIGYYYYIELIIGKIVIDFYPFWGFTS